MSVSIDAPIISYLRSFFYRTYVYFIVTKEFYRWMANQLDKRNKPITKEQMQQYANMKLESNYCMVHEHIPTEHLPILYYVGDGPYMVLATKKSQN